MSELIEKLGELFKQYLRNLFGNDINKKLELTPTSEKLDNYYFDKKKQIFLPRKDDSTGNIFNDINVNLKELTAIIDKVDNIDVDMNAISTKLETQITNLENLNLDTTNLQAIITDINDVMLNVQNLQAIINDINSLTAIISDVENILTKITNVETLNTNIDGNIATIQNSIGSITTQNNIIDNVELLETRIANVETIINNIETYQLAIKQSIQNVENFQQNIQTDIADVDINIADLQNLQATIKSVQNDGIYISKDMTASDYEIVNHSEAEMINRVFVMLESPLQADHIDVRIKIDLKSIINVYDQTITTSSGTLSKLVEIQVPAWNDYTIYLWNNDSSYGVQVQLNLFFSKNLEPEILREPSDWDFTSSDLTLGGTGTWRDLDLSGILPSGTTWVRLLIYKKGTADGVRAFYMRPEGGGIERRSGQWDADDRDTYEWTFQVGANRIVEYTSNSIHTAVKIAVIAYGE